MTLEDVYTVAEAAKIWGLDNSTLQYACKGQKNYPPRFTPEECRQSGRTWLITKAGMMRVYGQPKSE